VADIYELAETTRIENATSQLLSLALRLPRLDLYICTPPIETLFARASEPRSPEERAIRPPLRGMADLTFVGDLAFFTSGGCLRCLIAMRGAKKKGPSCPCAGPRSMRPPTPCRTLRSLGRNGFRLLFSWAPLPSVRILRNATTASPPCTQSRLTGLSLGSIACVVWRGENQSGMCYHPPPAVKRMPP
jgi:hypothetical protein